MMTRVKSDAGIEVVGPYGRSPLGTNFVVPRLGFASLGTTRSLCTSSLPVGQTGKATSDF